MTMRVIIKSHQSDIQTHFPHHPTYLIPKKYNLVSVLKSLCVHAAQRFYVGNGLALAGPVSCTRYLVCYVACMFVLKLPCRVVSKGKS